MTALGWLIMIGSLLFVWSLCGWCYYQMLTQKEAPIEEVEHFHSA